MTISKVWIRLSQLMAILMALASGAGVFVASVYSKETASWAAQGIGQDSANLVVVFPALLISAHYLKQGSVRALLIWLGLLLYVVYSYVLYAFFVHFNGLFLIYIAVLGLSFYTLLGSAMNLRLNQLSRFFVLNDRAGPVSVFLMMVGAFFSVMWLLDIARALIGGEAPSGVSVGPVVMMATVVALALYATYGFLRETRLVPDVRAGAA